MYIHYVGSAKLLTSSCGDNGLPGAVSREAKAIVSYPRHIAVISLQCRRCPQPSAGVGARGGFACGSLVSRIRWEICQPLEEAELVLVVVGPRSARSTTTRVFDTQRLTSVRCITCVTFRFLPCT
jgi:hypothetical protein